MMYVWRLAIVIVLFTVMQVAVFTHLRIFGVVPDLGLVLAVAVAYRAGPEAGALTGFAAGLLYDLFLETPLALSALSYALTGYVIGLLVSGLMRSPRWIAPALGAAGGVLGGLCFIGIGGLVGVPGMWTAHALVVVLVSSAYDALIAPFVFALVKRLSREGTTVTSTWSMR
ncbi:MAG: rod shape-determining protein MreD [Acidimicrobiia bacterium]